MVRSRWGWRLRRRSQAPARALHSRLRGLGQAVNEQVERTVLPLPRSGEVNFVVLARVTSGEQPEQNVHGYGECIRCGHPVYLGRETVLVVARGQAYPVCENCAAPDLAADRLRQD